MNEAFFLPGHEEYLTTTVEPTLNAFATHLAKTVRDATFIDQRPTYKVWSPEQLRRTQLIENVCVLAAHTTDSSVNTTRGKQAITLMSHLQFENIFSDHTFLPEQFRKTALSKFFQEISLIPAHRRTSDTRSDGEGPRYHTATSL